MEGMGREGKGFILAQFEDSVSCGGKGGGNLRQLVSLTPQSGGWIDGS